MPGTEGEKVMVRRWKVLVRLATARRSVTRRELANELGVDKKTIGRDIDCLSAAGFAIRSEEGKRGERASYRIDPSFRMPSPIAFTLSELAAIQIARAQLEGLAGHPFDDALGSASTKIASLLIEKDRPLGGATTRLAALQEHGWIRAAVDRGIVARVTQAIAESRHTDIVYARRGREDEFPMRIQPQRILLHQGGLYLVAWVRKSKGFRTLALERIRSARLLAGSFEPHPEKEIERHYENAFGLFTDKPFRVRIRFAREIAPFVAGRSWHPTQKIRTHRDGSIVLSAEVSGSMEVEAWVLRHGARAEVLEPGWLRERVADQVREMAKLYRVPA